MANPSINSPTFSLQNHSSFPLYWKPLFSQFSIPSLLCFLPLIAPHRLRLALLRIISASSAVCYPFRTVTFLHSADFCFSGGEQSILRRRVRVSLSFVLFVCLCGVAGAVSLISVCWRCNVYYDVDLGSNRVGALGNLGFRGFVIGLVYGFHYVYKQRWVFRFPIIQRRPPFFSYKMGLPLSIGRALRFSAVGYALSGVDGAQGSSSRLVQDPVHVPVGPVTRARAKKFKENLMGLVQEVWRQELMKRPIEVESPSLINMIKFEEWAQV